MGLDRIVHAAKLAGIHNEIMGMQMGYETVLGRSWLVFVGRSTAAARNRPCLGDRSEDTHFSTKLPAILDAVTERIVNSESCRAACPATKIIVAHRLSTIRDADLVLVIDSGKVIEQGKT